MRIFHRLTRASPTLAAMFLIVCGQPSRMLAQPASGAGTGPVLEKWIDNLAVAESGNRQWIVHQDRDGGYNYGCLQFRERTFRFYVEKFKLVPSADPAEVMDLIYDCAFQKRLAARMIRENPDNWKHWRKTVGRIGLPPRSTTEPESANADPSDRD
jgi:hypothetical protein